MPNKLINNRHENKIVPTKGIAIFSDARTVIAAEEFLNILGGKSKPTCNIDDGIRVLALIEAARQSSSTEKVIKLDTLQ